MTRAENASARFDSDEILGRKRALLKSQLVAACPETAGDWNR